MVLLFGRLVGGGAELSRVEVLDNFETLNEGGHDCRSAALGKPRGGLSIATTTGANSNSCTHTELSPWKEFRLGRVNSAEGAAASVRFSSDPREARGGELKLA